MKTSKLHLIPLFVLGLVVAFSSCKDEKEEYVWEENRDRVSDEVQQDVFYHCNIASANDLVSFAQRVNSGEKNLNAKVINDIDASKIKWSPIAPLAGDASNPSIVFNGVFNGNGHVISGLTVDDETADNVALFGALGTSALVKDVKVSYVSFNANKGVAAISVVSQGTIQNCEILSGAITATADVAGICAYNYGVILKSVNRAEITGEENVGGICAMNNNGLVNESENAGEVVGQQDAIIGGITALNSSTIVNCKNSGKVRNGFSAEGTGGICGQNYAIVYNCFNEGNIEGGTCCVAGICGKLKGENLAEIKNCISVGPIQPMIKNGFGAIVGWVSGTCEISTCYYGSENSMVSDGFGEPASASTMCTSVRSYLNKWISEEGGLYVNLLNGTKSVSLDNWKVVNRELNF